MGAVYFYHLTETPLEDTLPMLVGKAQGAGWRVLVRGRTPAVLQRLDARLWQGAPTSFQAHGMAGGPHDDSQPVLLGVDTPADGFGCVMSVDGADVTAAEVSVSMRTCVLFDGYDQDALAHARTQWKALTGAGCEAQYWAQDMGSWIKKAESAGA
ncbi:MAG: DNA polymerase III subunit chi [Yoonia sp.]|nr:DNA polymerase III subunit chi [Yoonia sp.]